MIRLPKQLHRQRSAYEAVCIYAGHLSGCVTLSDAGITGQFTQQDSQARRACNDAGKRLIGVSTRHWPSLSYRRQLADATCDAPTYTRSGCYRVSGYLRVFHAPLHHLSLATVITAAV